MRKITHVPVSAQAKMDDGELLLPADVASLLGIDPKTVTRYARLGRIPSRMTPGGHRRFHPDDIRPFTTPVTPDTPVKGPAEAVLRTGGGARTGLRGRPSADEGTLTLGRTVHGAAITVTTASAAWLTALITAARETRDGLNGST